MLVKQVTIGVLNKIAGSWRIEEPIYVSINEAAQLPMRQPPTSIDPFIPRIHKRSDSCLHIYTCESSNPYARLQVCIEGRIHSHASSEHTPI